MTARRRRPPAPAKAAGLLFGTLCAGLCAGLGAPGPLSAELLPVRSLSTADGLPHDRVKRVRTDRLGFLWLCTTEGLSRFDGRNFVNYGVSEGLPVPSVNDLVETPKGFWVATNGGGIAFFEPNSVSPRFRPLRVGGDGASRVNVLRLDGRGTLWAGTDGGLFRVAAGDALDRGAAFEPVALGIPGQPEASVMVWALEELPNGLAVGTRFGLVVLPREGPPRRVPLDPEGFATVLSLARAEDGRLLAGTLGAGLFTLDAEARSVVARTTPADGLPSATVSALQVSPGRLLAGTDQGLAVLSGGAVHAYTRSDGLTDARVASVAEDRDGGIWLATPGHGVMRLLLSGSSLFREADGLGRSAASIFERASGELCAVSADWNVARFEGRRFVATRPRLPARLGPSAWRSYHGFLHDSLGGFWFATGEGIYRFGPVRRLEELATARPVAVYTERDGLASNDPSRLFEDRRGDVWIGTFASARDPLTRFDRRTGRFERYGAAHGLPSLGSPTRFAEDAAGGVWIGYRDGTLARYRDGRFRVLSGRNGFPDAPVAGFASDPSGRLWATTTGHGLLRVDQPGADEPVAVTYGPSQGVPGFYLSSVVSDRDGRIYFGTSRDLMRLDPRTGVVTEVGGARGLILSEVTSAYRDRAGTLWFGSLGGLTRLGDRPDPPGRRPGLRVVEVEVSGRRVPVPATGLTEIDLGELPSAASLSFELIGLGLSGEPLSYQHRLQGLDRSWSSPRPERTLQYGRLPGGTYRLLVRAVGRTGGSSPEASVAFTIRPPVWRRWWFLSGAALLLAGLGYGAEALRWRRRRQVDSVRARIASDLHDDLGAGLTRISILAEVAARRAREGAPADDLLESIGKASRSVVEKLSDGIWAVDPRRDDLKSLGERIRQAAEELLEPAGIAWRVEVPAGSDRVRLDPEGRRQIYLLMKEALANAARHSGGRHATIRMAAGGGRLAIELTDDGKGISPEAAGAPDGARGLVGGRGLGNMRERARALGGTLEIVGGPGSGTTVKLDVPEPRA